MDNQDKIKKIQEMVTGEVSRFLVSIREMMGLSEEEATRRLGYPSVEKLKNFETGAVSVPMCEMHHILISYKVPEPAETMMVFQFVVQTKVQEIRKGLHPYPH